MARNQKFQLQKWVKNDRKYRKKWQKKISCVKTFFPLTLPKKHCLITQNRFWPFFVWLFRGPQNYIFWLFKSVFWQFLCEKNGRKSRDPARGLVYEEVGCEVPTSFSIWFNLSFMTSFLVSRRSSWRPKESRSSVRPFVRSSRSFSKNHALLFFWNFAVK